MTTKTPARSQAKTRKKAKNKNSPRTNPTTPVVDVTNGAIVIHTQRLKSDPGGNLLS